MQIINRGKYETYNNSGFFFMNSWTIHDAHIVYGSGCFPGSMFNILNIYGWYLCVAGNYIESNKPPLVKLHLL